MVQARNIIMNRNKGALTLTRAGRQMSVVSSLQFPTKENNFDITNNHRNWNVEVDFHPGLDEQFHVPSSKQSASPGVEAWLEFEKHKMHLVISEMKSDWDKQNAIRRNKLKAQSREDGTHKVVQDVITEVRKKDIKSGTPEDVIEAIENKKEQIKSQLNTNGKTTTSEIKNILEEVDLDFEFREESRPESPFYRVQLDGNTGQVAIYLNTAHLFYQTLFTNVSVAQQDALKYLIYSIADTELNASPQGRLWYKRHRPLWSEKLSQTLTEHKKRYSDDMLSNLTPDEIKQRSKAEA